MMNWPAGEEPSDQGNGRRFLTKGQYLELVGQEVYDRQMQRLRARTHVEGLPSAAGDAQPHGNAPPNGGDST